MKLELFVWICCCILKASCQDPKTVSHEEFTFLKNEVREIASTLKQIKQHLGIDGMNKGTIGPENEIMNDTTTEERVTILEFQVETLSIEVTDVGEDLDLVEGEIALISADQILQDERIFELEMDSDDLADSMTALEATVSTVENSVSLVNYTLSEAVLELNTELDSLNTTVGTVDIRVTTVEVGLTSLEETVAEIDNRVGHLELTGAVAFQADLDVYTSIPEGSTVIFDLVHLNIGNGYNSSTGKFTVPVGGAGLYFLYINFFAADQEAVDFNIGVNESVMCRAVADMTSSGADDNGTPSCGTVATLDEGDVVDVMYRSGTDDTPVISDTVNYNTFTGFRIAPE